MAAIYFDRLFNLSLITQNDQLRDQIQRAIIDYAKWYGAAPNLAATEAPNSPWRLAAGPGMFSHSPASFAGTQLHIASLAALARDRQDSYKGPATSKDTRYTIPDNVLAGAQQGAPTPLPG